MLRFLHSRWSVEMTDFGEEGVYGQLPKGLP